jgi:hypothetical protein
VTAVYGVSATATGRIRRPRHLFAYQRVEGQLVHAPSLRAPCCRCAVERPVPTDISAAGSPHLVETLTDFAQRLVSR